MYGRSMMHTFLFDLMVEVFYFLVLATLGHFKKKKIG